MKRSSCVNFNYGYYGPKKECMLGRKCTNACSKYERRKGRNRKTKRSVSISDVNRFNRRGCIHKKLEVISKRLIVYCSHGVKLTKTGICSRPCAIEETNK